MKTRKIFLICFIILIILCGCNREEEKEESLQEIIQEEKAILVDVRTKEEYEESHIKDAINIPYDEIDEKVKLDKTKKIYVYCKSGKRSQIAYEKLKALGYEVKDLGAYNTIDLERIKGTNENIN